MPNIVKHYDLLRLLSLSFLLYQELLAKYDKILDALNDNKLLLQLLTLSLYVKTWPFVKFDGRVCSRRLQRFYSSASFAAAVQRHFGPRRTNRRHKIYWTQLARLLHNETFSSNSYPDCSGVSACLGSKTKIYVRSRLDFFWFPAGFVTSLFVIHHYGGNDVQHTNEQKLMKIESSSIYV